MIISLKGRVIPRNAQGDPSFATFYQLNDVFSLEEICEMCNRYLYQVTYQQTAHLKRAKAASERLAPIREYLRKHFHTTLDKATGVQIQEAKMKTSG